MDPFTAPKKIGPSEASTNDLAPGIVLPEVSLTSRPEIAFLMPALEALVRDLSAHYPPFPHRCCEVAATRVEALGLGLDYVNGVFLQPVYGHSHAWNMSAELGVYVDITAKQFCDSLPSILITPIDSDLARKHYLRDEYVMW